MYAEWGTSFLTKQPHFSVAAVPWQFLLCSLAIPERSCSAFPERVLHVAAEQAGAFVCTSLLCFILLTETKVSLIHAGKACFRYCFAGYFEVCFPPGFFLASLFDLLASYKRSSWLNVASPNGFTWCFSNEGNLRTSNWRGEGSGDCSRLRGAHGMTAWDQTAFLHPAPPLPQEGSPQTRPGCSSRWADTWRVIFSSVCAVVLS